MLFILFKLLILRNWIISPSVLFNDRDKPFAPTCEISIHIDIDTIEVANIYQSYQCPLSVACSADCS